MSTVARLFVCLMLVWQGAASAAEVVRFPRPESEGDRHFACAPQLLKLGLTGTDYRIELAPVSMNQECQILEFEAGRTIDFAPIPHFSRARGATASDPHPHPQGCSRLEPGPISKGDQGRFAGTDSLDDLKHLRLYQGRIGPTP